MYQAKFRLLAFWWRSPRLHWLVKFSAIFSNIFNARAIDSKDIGTYISRSVFVPLNCTYIINDKIFIFLRRTICNHIK